MHSRRLLFLAPRPRLSLAPILAALWSLVALSLTGFVVAFWPKDPAPAAYQPGRGEAAPASRSQEEGRIPSEASKTRKPGTWV